VVSAEFLKVAEMGDQQGGVLPCSTTFWKDARVVSSEFLAVRGTQAVFFFIPEGGQHV
jgi:hypothetical protein